MTKKSARFASLIVLVVLLVGVVLAAPPQAASGTPQYTKDGELLRPADYRDWVFLSSGFGMSYSPSGHAMFTNVFVPRPAYEQFLNTGKWPEKTMFVVEERDSSDKGSIVKAGHFQTEDLMGIGVEVKDSAQFPADKWAYFGFRDNATAKANPKAACWQCHEDHAAVEHSFVQFYPTLKPVAKKFGVYKMSAENVVPDKTTEAAPPAPHGPETSTWVGILHTPDQHEQRVILHVFGSGENLSATADSPDENAYAMPVAAIALTSNSLRFSLPQFGGEFNGTLAGSQATGTYSQNGTQMPLVLSKK